MKTHGACERPPLNIFCGVFSTLVLLLHAASPILAQPAITLTPDSLTFDPQPILTTSGAKIVTLQNSSAKKLAGFRITVSGPFAQSNDCRALDGGGSCLISVTFSPQTAGPAAGTLIVSDNRDDSPQTVSLSGTGVLPLLLSSASLAFDPQTVGTTSDAQSVTLTNNQSASLESIAVTASGDFFETNTCPPSLPAGGTCTISVTFRPTGAGSRIGNITVTDTASTSPQIISLSGAGVIDLTLSSSSLTFGTQPVGQSSAPQDITLVNPSSVAVTISSITVSGDYLQTNTCGTMLAGNQSCNISVTFLPTAPGMRSGTLIVTSTAGNSPQSVSLSGSAEIQLTLFPASLGFGSIRVGESSTRDAILTNNGSTAADIGSVVVSGDYTQTNTCGSSLAAGTSCTITVIFEPSATGPRSGEVTVTESGSSQVLSLSGTGYALSSIRLSPASRAVASGTALSFSAAGVYTDGSTKDLSADATWETNNSAVATVSPAGVLSAISPGSVTVSATLGGVTGSAVITVAAATLISITVSPGDAQLPQSYKQQFSATGTFSDATVQDISDSVTWTSSSSDVVTVASNGLATTVSAGAASIEAALGSVSQAITVTVTDQTLIAVRVVPEPVSIPLSFKMLLRALGDYSDGSSLDLTEHVSWSSADSGVASVSSRGLVTGLSVGSTTVSAARGVLTGFASVNVTDAQLSSFTIEPAESSVPSGITQPFTASGVFNDSSTMEITASVHWSSDNPTIATISNSVSTAGAATTLAGGIVTIKADLLDAFATAVLTVTPAVLTSVDVSPASASVTGGLNQQFTATGKFTDASTQDLTSAAIWSSSVPTVATVAVGLATGISQGGTTITAISGSISGTATLTVTAPVLTSLTVSPSTATVGAGQSQPFTATGMFSDGSMADLTATASWSASPASVASVSSDGSATGLEIGNAMIQASAEEFSGTALLTVTEAVLTSISIAPADQILLAAATLNLTATGRYSDGTSQDLTSSVAWASSDENVASVDSAGSAMALASGTATISAVLGEVTGSTTLTSYVDFVLANQSCPMAHCDSRMSDIDGMLAPPGPIVSILASDDIPEGAKKGLGCSSDGEIAACSYSNTLSGNLVAYRSDGSVIFRSSAAPGIAGYLNEWAYASAPIISNDQDIIAADSISVARYDSAGNVLWQTTTPGGIAVSPVLTDNGLVVTATYGGPVSAYSLADGRLIGSLWLSEPVSGSYFETVNTPAAIGHRVYVSTALHNDPYHTGRLYAIDVDPSNSAFPLTIAWFYTFGGPSGASPLRIGNTIYFDGDRPAPCSVPECAVEPQLFAVLDAGSSGQLQWQRAISNPVRASAAEDPRGSGVWFFGAGSQFLYMFNKDTGETIDTIDLNALVADAAWVFAPSSVMSIARNLQGDPILITSAVAVSPANGPVYLCAVNLQTRQLAWKVLMGTDRSIDTFNSQFPLMLSPSGEPIVIAPGSSSGAHFIGN